MKKYVCKVCGVEYDPAVGDPDSGIAPGTAFEDLPDTWCCPACGAAKADFVAAEEDGGAASAAPAGGGSDMSMWQCQTNNCGYIYNSAKGDRKGKIAKGVSFDDLPDDWVCPVCGATKKMFKKLG